MWAFLLTCLLIELTPGPNMSWLAVMGAAQGRKAAYAAVAGIGLGLAVAGIAAGVGLAALIAAEPAIFNTLRWAGSAYLLYLAYDAWTDDGTETLTAESPWRYFLQGLISNILNPKAYLFYAAILPQFIDRAEPIVAQVVLLTIGYVAVATGVHATIGHLSSSLAPWLSTSPAARTIRRIMAVAIAGVAIWFFLATRLSA